MRIAKVVAGVVVLLGSATGVQGARAATPLISGTYIGSGSSNCQAVVSVTKNLEGQVVDIQVRYPGALNTFVGTARFDPTTGRVRVSARAFEGPPFVLPGDSRRIRPQPPLDEDWAYANDETTVTLRGVVYQVVYGKRSGNVVQQFALAGREDDNRCAFGATFIRR